MFDWDSSIQLSEVEESMQREYADRIVKSISLREKDPLKVRVLLLAAADIAYEIWFAATGLRANLRERKD